MADVHLLDTSVAVALMVEAHEAHGTCMDFVAGKRLGLAGHAFFETLSVLTRLPGAQRPTPRAAYEALVASFPHTHYLSSTGSLSAATSIADRGIGGGAVYDALVAAAACEAELPLASRDARALATYRAIGARVVLVP